MTIDESFDELYKLLRGSRCAAPLLQARTSFDAGDVNQTLVELQKIRQTYIDSRKSLLDGEANIEFANVRDSQQRKRQAKASDAVEHFDELISLLTIQSKKTKPSTPAANNSLPKPEYATKTESATASAPSVTQAEKFENRLRQELAVATSEQEVRKILEPHFEFVPVDAEHQLASGERMVLFSNGLGHVIQIDDPAYIDNSVRVLTWFDQKHMLPIPTDKFLKSAAKRRILRLVLRHQEGNESTSEEANRIEAHSKDENKLVSETAERDKILDMGAFTQLLDAAQRSGIVLGSNIIIQVRDCEYRLGKYNKALQMMETLFTTFLGSESQRNQRLQREEMEIASGRKKMSPRELQLKRSQDNQATQAVDRTKVRFQRVLEGLRGLLHLENTATAQD
ncbi:MAG: hypothetical protein ACOVQM_09400 [Pirellula sp.]